MGFTHGRKQGKLRFRQSYVRAMLWYHRTPALEAEQMESDYLASLCLLWDIDQPFVCAVCEKCMDTCGSFHLGN